MPCIPSETRCIMGSSNYKGLSHYMVTEFEIVYCCTVHTNFALSRKIFPSHTVLVPFFFGAKYSLLAGFEPRSKKEYHTSKRRNIFFADLLVRASSRGGGNKEGWIPVLTLCCFTNPLLSFWSVCKTLEANSQTREWESLSFHKTVGYWHIEDLFTQFANLSHTRIICVDVHDGDGDQSMTRKLC